VGGRGRRRSRRRRDDGLVPRPPGLGHQRDIMEMKNHSNRIRVKSQMEITEEMKFNVVNNG